MLSALASGRFPPDILAAGGLSGMSNSLSAPPAQQQQSAGDVSGESAPRPERRRSLRLSAKVSSTSLSENVNAQASGSTGTPPSVASASTVVAPAQAKGKEINSNLRKDSPDEADDGEGTFNDEDLDSEGDFMDADVDAEVS